MPQGSDSGDQGASLAAPPMVALPSAEMLAAALGDGAVGQEASSKTQGLVADVLSQGDQAIDALLDVALSAQAGEAHALAAVAPGHGIDLPLVGLAIDHSLMQHMPLVHPGRVASGVEIWREGQDSQGTARNSSARIASSVRLLTPSFSKMAWR